MRRKQLQAQAATALTRLGYKRKEAEQAVSVAVEQLPRKSDVAAIVKESLRILTPS
jgi:Holliday junction resolvasome RuvABC DNA-binding subunit